MRIQLFSLVAVLALPGQVAVAQVPDAPTRTPGTTVSGVVRDSIGHAPLARAWVQLVAIGNRAGFARTVAADSLGQYAFNEVPNGRYALGFFHPLLDSLGVEPPTLAVNVRRSQAVHVDLAAPSAEQFRDAICRPQSAADAAVGAVVVGVVRDARTRAPIAGVTVAGEWLEITFRKGGFGRRRPNLVATTVANGWFSLCNVPVSGTMLLGATNGRDTTDLIEVHVPPSGFVRQELYLGSARTVTVRDTTPLGDSLALPPRILHLGDGQLRGTVVAAGSGQPLAGALVRIIGGPQTRANDRGEWTLGDAPTGTRSLEVRALGYYPAHRAVDVVTGAAAVAVELSTFKTMMDTVRIIVARAQDRSSGGFEERHRAGMGRFLTAEDIARRGAVFMSDVFRMVPGVRLDGSGTFERRILVRAINRGWCAPEVYIDGLRMFRFNADDIDGWLTPKNIVGVEIHSAPQVPPEFEHSRPACTVLAIWTK